MNCHSDVLVHAIDTDPKINPVTAQYRVHAASDVKGRRWYLAKVPRNADGTPADYAHNMVAAGYYGKAEAIKLCIILATGI